MHPMLVLDYCCKLYCSGLILCPHAYSVVDTGVLSRGQQHAQYILKQAHTWFSASEVMYLTCVML